MKALILAAGYATRLYPLTKEYPKPLLKVGSKPIINYILEKLEKIDEIGEILIVTNSKFISQFRRWAKGIKSKKPLRLIDDLTKNHNDRRGAIGDIDFVLKKTRLKDDLLVIGGDNLFNGGLQDFLAFAKTGKSHPVIGAYRLKDIRLARNYGVVKLDKERRLVSFQEKPKNPKSRLVAMCLYYFPRQKLGLISEYMNNKSGKSDATGFYIEWLKKRLAVYGFVFGGCWYDIGNHRFYNEAKKKFN